MTALLFPGQGSQEPGMAKSLRAAFPAVNESLLAASKASGLSIVEFCDVLPDAMQRKTEIAQPAIYALSFAILNELLRRGIPQPSVACGHSLGHFTALTAAGVFDLDTGINLVKERSRLMAEACAKVSGTMVAVNGLSYVQISEILDELKLQVWSANENYIQQTTVSGTLADLNIAINTLIKAGGKCKTMNVGGAFHTPLMKDHNEAFADLVFSVPMQAPKFPVLSNVSGAELVSTDMIRKDLAKQMTAPVRWRTMANRLCASHIKLGLEIGPGRVLKGLMLQNDRSFRVLETNTPARLERAAAEFSAG